MPIPKEELDTTGKKIVDPAYIVHKKIKITMQQFNIFFCKTKGKLMLSSPC